MECRDDEVSRLSEGKDRRYRLLITHFSDHDDIRILSHSIADCLFERRNMFSDLFLMDETLIISQNIFDRILDHDDVPMRILIQVIDHRDDTRGLSTSCTTRDEYESSILIQELQDIFFESDGFCSWEIFLDRSHRDSDPIHIFRDIRTESSALILIDEIHSFFFRIDSFLCDTMIHILDDREDISICESSESRHGLDIAIRDSYIGEFLTRNMQICHTCIDNLPDKEIEISYEFFLYILIHSEIVAESLEKNNFDRSNGIDLLYSIGKIQKNY